MPDLATQLRALIDAAADHITMAEVTSPFTERKVAPAPGPGPKRSRGAWWLTAAAAVIVIAATAVALASSGDDSTISTSGGGDGPAVEVLHQVIEYRQIADTACPDAVVSGEFDTMVFETWAEPVSGRWRQEVRYPDGSTRTTIAFGNPGVPTDVFNQGEWLGQTVRCGESGIVATEPGQNSIFFLDYPAAVPPPPGFEPGQDHRDPSRYGDKVDAQHNDSLGRASELWERVVTGADDAGPISQTESWWIDPATRVVTERRYANTITGPATYSWIATLRTNDTQLVDSAIFDTTGFEREPTAELPPPPDTVDRSEFPTSWE